MERLYFTFGSDSNFPYGRDDYVIAIGKTREDCISAYMDKYPPREPGSKVINCADFYDQAHWDKLKNQYFKDVQPKEILVSDTVYGKKPEGFEPIWFWVPNQTTLIYLQEGSGDNLIPEDVKNGYVDYLDYTCFDLDNGEVNESDGGEMMMTEYVQKRYSCLADAIPDILDFQFDAMFEDAQILKR